MGSMLTFEGTAATMCVASASHNPVPLRFVWHHIQPQEAGGQTVPQNLAQLCDSCFPYGTQVEYGKVQRASRRWYSGNLIQLRLDGDRDLTGTPNHPVLTGRGWLLLGQVQQGDYLIAYDRDAEPAVIEGDVHRKPAPIGQVFDALAVTGCVRVPGTGVDFHGERPCGDVDVVSADSQLRLDFQSATGQLGRDSLLPASYAEAGSLAGLSPADQLIFRSYPAPAGSVRRGGAGTALLAAHPGHPRGVSLAAAAPDDPVTFEEALEGTGADTGFGGKPVLGFPGQVTLRPVNSVRRIPFSGHVYNLQTSAGTYTANGMIVHNCHYTVHRLMWIYRLLALGQPVTPEQQKAITTPPRRAQLVLAGKGYEACRIAGTISKIPNEG